MLHSLLHPLLSFTVAFAVSLALTPVVAIWMNRLGVIDEPKVDRWHREPVALLGGIAIYAAFATAALWLRDPVEMGSLVVLGGAVFLIGFYDDRVGTHPRAKFLLQLAVALTVIVVHTRWLMPPLTLGDAVRVAASVLWLVGVTNAMNLLDNMDGLSAGVAGIAALGVSLLGLFAGQEDVVVLALGLAGASFGFLPYNYRPARLFMGDCGSLLLGFSLALLSWKAVLAPQVFYPGKVLGAVLVLSLPIYDTTFVTVMRILHDRPPWKGGRDHTSHRLARLVGSERRAVKIFYALGALAAVLGVLSWRMGVLVGAALALPWAGLLLWLAGEIAQVPVYAEAHRPAAVRRRRPPRLRAVEPAPAAIEEEPRRRGVGGV